MTFLWLELCEAIVDLIQVVLESLIIKVYAWSDSLIVFAWIRGEPSRQKAFVFNRISLENLIYFIKQLLEKENFMDLISHGEIRWLKYELIVIHYSFQNMRGSYNNWLVQMSHLNKPEIIRSKEKLERRIFSIRLRFYNQNNFGQVFSL